MRSFYLFGTCVCAVALLAQEAPAPAAARIIGEVVGADPARQQIVIKPDQGASLTVRLDTGTAYLRVPPGEKDLKNAVKISLADIGAGDRVLVRGRLAEDRQSIAASSVIVMTRADLAQKHQREREEWQRRGVAGTVTAVNAQAGEIVISTAPGEGSGPLTIRTDASTRFLRYAPDSVRFSDAKPGTLAELKTGDHLRALGDRTDGGSFLKAAEVVSGTFRNVAGTIKTVNAPAGELVITDLATHKPLTVKVNADATTRKLPPMMAAMLARRFNPGATGGAAPQAGAAGPQNRPWGGQRPGGGPGGDPQQWIERMPALAITDLKPGDAVIVSSTQGTDPARITAITLVAGVEPLLTAAPQGQVGGAWNFGDIGMPQ